MSKMLGIYADSMTKLPGKNFNLKWKTHLATSR